MNEKLTNVKCWEYAKQNHYNKRLVFVGYSVHKNISWE